jgi:dTDP-glucose 4,6-dehydratase
MNWENKKVLITGGGGFIGSHLVQRLVAMKADVFAFLRYNSRADEGLLNLLPKDVRCQIKVIFGDLQELETVKKAMEGIEIVFHLGALIGIPYSYFHPREVFNVNTYGILNILTSAKEKGVERIVHTSTSEVYGTAQYVPIDENHPLQAQSPYSASKISADKIVESFYLSYGLPVTTIRPFNAYGPRQSARAIIPTIITQALTKDEISLGTLSPTRDFTFVTDTVEGFIKMAESEKALGEVVNIGSGYEISIGELVQKIISLVGKKEIKIKSEKERFRPTKSEVKRLWADNTKAKELIGWQPQVSLEEGLKRTIDWISSSLSLYNPDIFQI